MVQSKFIALAGLVLFFLVLVLEANLQPADAVKIPLAKCKPKYTTKKKPCKNAIKRW